MKHIVVERLTNQWNVIVRLARIYTPDLNLKSNLQIVRIFPSESESLKIAELKSILP